MRYAGFVGHQRGGGFASARRVRLGTAPTHVATNRGDRARSPGAESDRHAERGEGKSLQDGSHRNDGLPAVLQRPRVRRRLVGVARRYQHAVDRERNAVAGYLLP